MFISSRFTKKSLLNTPGRSVDTSITAVGIGVHRPHATQQNRHLGHRQISMSALSISACEGVMKPRSAMWLRKPS
ncbi:MAG: hypothetical protein CM15mP74_23140 [Halieaceae bacterium]|nr:MAG: hypothetical protein CM15mP74_23140 [Halieaceae bacterium]